MFKVKVTELKYRMNIIGTFVDNNRSLKKENEK